jgi:hypothetical protein
MDMREKIANVLHEEVFTSGGEICGIEDAADAILEALQGMVKTREWKPIETAPKDGTQFLGVYDNGVSEVKYSIIKWDGLNFLGMCDGDAAHDDFGYWVNPLLTHWMPLPAAPKVGE